MNAKLLGAFLLCAALMQGCIVVSNGGGGGHPPAPAVPGDVTFTWSFSGGTCSDVPDVKSLHIDIPGQSLQNGGIYPCLADNYPGITLHDFAAGSYTFTIEALDYGNRSIFVGSGAFTVNGNVRVTLDLTPNGQPNSYAYLTWRFPPIPSVSQNPTCAQAGMTQVQATIDGVPVSSAYNCEDGFTSQGVATPYLAPGNHAIVLEALDQYGYRYFVYQGTLQTFAGDPVSAEYHLAWSVGGTSVSWSFTTDNGSTALDCAQAGVSTVYVNFRREDGSFVYPDAGDPVPCNARPATYNFLQAGKYWVYVQAAVSGGSYASSGQTPPQITVTAGEFSDGTSPTTLMAYYQSN